MASCDNKIYSKVVAFSLFAFVGLFLSQFIAVLLMLELDGGDAEYLKQNLGLIHWSFLTWFSCAYLLLLCTFFVIFIDREQKAMAIAENLGLKGNRQIVLHLSLAALLAFIYFYFYIEIISYFELAQYEKRQANSIFLIAVFAGLSAISEEIAFRAYLLGIFIRVKKINAGIITSSLIFTLFHLINPIFDFVLLLNTFLLGMMLGITRVKFANIYFSITFHVVYNFLYTFLGLNNLITHNDFSRTVFNFVPHSKAITGGESCLTGSIVFTLLTLVCVVCLTQIKSDTRVRSVE